MRAEVSIYYLIDYRGYSVDVENEDIDQSRYQEVLFEWVELDKKSVRQVLQNPQTEPRKHVLNTIAERFFASLNRFEGAYEEFPQRVIDLGLTHTSMSAGDVIEVTIGEVSWVLLCETNSWKEVQWQESSSSASD